MTQQDRSQKPKRPQDPNQRPAYPQQGKQQNYPSQYPQQDNQQAYPPQYPNQGNYPPPPPTSYHQAPQQVEVVHRQKNNPILAVFYVLLWPFAKIFEFLRYIIKIILEEMLRGVIRFIFGLIFLAVFFVLLAAFFVYVVAFFQVNYSFADAFPRMIDIIKGLLPF